MQHTYEYEIHITQFSKMLFTYQNQKTFIADWESALLKDNLQVPTLLENKF